MALIDCPSCGKKISDKAETCPHCGFALKNASVEDIERKQALTRYKKLSSLQNQSMLAILVFILGFGFMNWGTRPGELQHNLAMVACVLGFIWYIINRVRVLMVKRFSG
jgi:ribosomal protein L37E